MQFAYTETRKPGKVGDRPTIDSLRIDWPYDETMTPTFIEDEGEEYREENEKRLAAYNRGDWWYIGCVAHAVVSYPIDDRGNRRLQEFSSAGLWGIESDCDKEYQREVEKEELDSLKEHLEIFGVDTADFWQIAATLRRSGDYSGRSEE